MKARERAVDKLRTAPRDRSRTRHSAYWRRAEVASLFVSYIHPKIIRWLRDRRCGAEKGNLAFKLGWDTYHSVHNTYGIWDMGYGIKVFDVWLRNFAAGAMEPVRSLMVE